MRIVAATLFALSLAACAPPVAQQHEYELLVRVDADPGEGLGNVPLYHGGRRIGVTGIDGSVRVKLPGGEGERTSLRAECPATHSGPNEPTVVVLRSYQGQGLPEVDISCPPRTRKLAVVVKARNGADLPIVHRGKTIGRTDAAGTAHLLLKGPPGDAFEVSLDTSSRPELNPKDPGGRFVIASRDEAVLFDPELEIERAAPPRKHRPVHRGPTLPTRIR
jgi:hypothetical protein